MRFPDHLRTHSAEQVLFFDERRRLRRHDDTAEAFGDWARAAHLCTEHRDLGGLSVPTRRRVHPRGRGGRPRRRPLLVWIDVRDLTPSSSPELG